MSLLLAPEFFPMNERDLDAVSALETSVQAFPWSRGNFAMRASVSCFELDFNSLIFMFYCFLIISFM
jgi:hypothetical protein